MVSPYSAGTFTLQEAPSFAWRTNGLPITRAERSEGTAAGRVSDHGGGGFIGLLGRRVRLGTTLRSVHPSESAIPKSLS